ncbi:MAG TPA: serine hydrolase domain-containing protein [Thermomicrobiales bacterium]|nr:serine hydrolase domain-containing protein [Thermomicrobiales bacterium]
MSKLEGFVHEQMQKWKVPGVAVGIFDGDDVEFAGFGITNIETGQPVAPETLFQIGSISKIFTATLAMTLVDDGLLDLDAPIVTYVPELQLADAGARERITARHLLTHRAGFYGDRFDDHGNGDDALERAVRDFGDLPQSSGVDELYTYCNAGIDLIGRAIENILGQTFESAMRERVFERLGLERSTYFASEAIRHAVAVGHTVGGEDGQTVADPWPIPRRSNAAGGVTSNVPELIRFAVMHLRNGAIGEHRVISEASAQAMRTVQAEADYEHKRGLAWALKTYDGLAAVEHGGATNGFMARLILIPEQNYAIAVLTNGEFGSSLHNAVTKKALEQRFGITISSPARVSLSDAQLKRFVGAFVHRLGDVTITTEHGGLAMSRISRNVFSGEERDFGSVRISPVEESVFIVDDGPLTGAFGELLPGENGQVKYLRLNGRLLQPQG